MRISRWIPALFLFVFGCRSGGDSVGLFIYKEEDLFMRALTRNIRTESMGRLDLKIHHALDSQIIQNEQIENHLRSGASLMIVNPVDRIGAHAVVRKLKAENVPVIFFNREPLPRDLELWENSWYIGARAEQSGRMQAELVMELFGSNPRKLNEYDRSGDGIIQAVILKGEQGHQDAEIRTSTVRRTFREHGYRLEILATEVANWSRDQGYERMGFFLDEHEGRLELVLSNNDAMAIGAISMMRQRGLFKDSNGNGIIDKDDVPWIPVVGIDGVPEAVVQIEEGYLYGTVLNDSASMAEAIVALAEGILSGGVPDDFPYPITGGNYVWIDYKTFKLD